MEHSHRIGEPLIRPMFFDFPSDPACWDLPDQYLFGPDVLVAPVLHMGQRSREVYLPLGAQWLEKLTGRTCAGGQTVSAAAPLEAIPVFLRDGSHRDWIES